jgi:large repetitive protein
VWNDRDGDGVQGAGEPGIPGVTITATWSDGTRSFSVSTVTGADGMYTLPNLPSGAWTVVPSNVPAGFAGTSENDGVVDGVDHETLATLQDQKAADFGFRGAGTIGDTVFLDRDGDGTQGAGEPGVPGQRVDLLWAGADGVFGTADDETWTTTTGSSGGYAFGFLPDGAFRVTVVGGIADRAANTGDPDGGADATAQLTLTGGASDLTQDFGFRGANAVGDTVWWDQDGDGTKNGAEPGLSGVRVEVTWFGPDGVLGGGDDIVLSTTTDADGVYGVGDLPDGKYRVAVAGGIPAGFAPSVDGGDSTPDGTSETTLTGSTTDLAQDFGYRGAGALGDTVYLDRDGDGAQQAGEPGIPGATVTVVWAGATGAPSQTFTAVTDAQGKWKIADLPAGDYTITVTGVPAGLSNTGDPDGGADSTAQYALAAGEQALDEDFGYRGTASVGDTVWLDVDGDGTQNGNEPGLPGIPVTVRSAGADGVLDTADDIVTVVTTDADGRYTADGLPAGATRVSYDPADLPAGDKPASDLDGGDAASTELVLTAGTPVTDADFAVRGTGTLAGVVFDDRDGNGSRGAGEPGVAGVGVTVTWQGPNGPVIVHTTTGPDGSWSIGKLPTGTYTVTLDPATFPRGFHPSTAQTVTVTLAAGATQTAVFGISTAGLAVTGTDVTAVTAAGLLLLLAGGLAVWGARRMRRSAEQD